MTYLIGSLGYAFMMSVLYLFTFNEYEMLNLSSFERYMATYMLAESLITSYIFLYFNNITKRINNYLKNINT